MVNRPDVKGREGILGVHTKKIPVGDDVDVEFIVPRWSPEFLFAIAPPAIEARLAVKIVLSSSTVSSAAIAPPPPEWASLPLKLALHTIMLKAM